MGGGTNEYLMKSILATLALTFVTTAAHAQSYVWVQTSFTQPQDAFTYVNHLMFYGRDGLTINENTTPKQYSVNTTCYLFVRECNGAVTNEPSWHPDVATLQNSNVFQTYPLVGNGTFTTYVFWGISYYTRDTTESFEKYDSNSQPTGETATRTAKERISQYIWAYGE